MELFTTDETPSFRSHDRLTETSDIKNVRPVTRMQIMEMDVMRTSLRTFALVFDNNNVQYPALSDLTSQSIP
jgi:hypothetical protein